MANTARDRENEWKTLTSEARTIRGIPIRGRRTAKHSHIPSEQLRDRKLSHRVRNRINLKKKAATKIQAHTRRVASEYDLFFRNLKIIVK